MQVTVTRRHTSALPKLQRYARERLAKIVSGFQSLHDATVILDEEGGLHRVECAVSVGGGPRLVASAASSDWNEAVNQAEGRLESQLRRFFDRRRDLRRG